METIIISTGSAEADRIKQLLTPGGSLTGAASGTPNTVANVAGAIPAGGVGAAAGAFDTAGNRDTFITTVTEIKTQLNALLTELRARKFVS
jgi:hypothetical protein